MSLAIRNWRQSRRYRSTVRRLRSLSRTELNALGIRPGDIEHLAEEVSRLQSRVAFIRRG